MSYNFSSKRLRIVLFERKILLWFSIVYLYCIFVVATKADVGYEMLAQISCISSHLKPESV